MINRLLLLVRLTLIPAGLVACMFIPTALTAQSSYFTFNYSGPTVVGVGPTCSFVLQGNIPNPTVSSKIGANITMWAFNPVSSGFLYSDIWTIGQTAAVHWLAKDDQGHQDEFVFYINFVDNTPPAFDLTGVPSTLVFSSVAQIPLQPPAIPAHDNCTPDNQIVRTFNETPRPDTCQGGIFTRTWTATDLENNTATFTQTITIYKDSLPPTIATFPQNGSAPCTQLSTAYPAWLAAQMVNFTATDPSGIKSITNNAPANFPTGCAVPLTVTFRATDNCGFIMPTTAVFSTSDNTPPMISGDPLDTVAYCSPTGNQYVKLGNWIHKHGFIIAHDACAPDNLLIYKMRINGIPKDSAQVVSAFTASYANGCGPQIIGSKIYQKIRAQVTVEFYVEDPCGNTTFAGPATFGAIDTLPPVITGVNTTEECGGGNDNSALLTWINAHGNATATDDCSSVTWTNFSWVTSTGQTGNGNFNSGPYPSVQAHNCTWFVDVTFRATDDCLNTGAKTLRFQIHDTQKPVIAGFPPTVTLPCTNPHPTLSPGFVTDNCDTSMVIAFTAVYKDSLCNGSYTMLVTWSATDDCGNTGTAMQTVLIRDTQGPAFTLVPDSLVMRCDTFALPAAPVMGISIKATDNCSPVTGINTQVVSAQDPNPAHCGHYSYNITRVFTATDQCGNTSTATQLIRVIDNLGPVITLEDTTVVCSAPALAKPPVGNDACSGPTAAPVKISQVFTQGACDDAGTLTLTWKAIDVCNNTSTAAQHIHIIDTIPPAISNIPANIMVECNAVPAPPAINTLLASDNCDNSVNISMAESQIRNPDESDCSHWTNYLIKREWTATDNCGNTRRYTQIISVQDNTGPIIVPPAPVSLPADHGVCGANIIIPPPLSVYDGCTSLLSNVTLKDTVLLTGPPNNSAPVDTVVLKWTVPNLPPLVPVADSGTLTIFLENVDADSSQEFFYVYGEDGGPPIGKTANTLVQCGSSTTILTISAAKLNAWMADGDLILRLAPNGSGGNAINKVCQGGRVRATLVYPIANQKVLVTLAYSLDGGPTKPFPPPGNVFLDVGVHNVVYTARDCAGNTSTASSTITVQDLQPPILETPANITTYVGNNCQVTVALPFPGITENCSMSGSLSQASPLLSVQFQSDPDVGKIPKDITMSISGLVPNAIGNGTLKIRYRGDNGNLGEFFKIYDDTPSYISATDTGSIAGECNTYHETSFTVTAAQINNWAISGSTFFTAVANNDLFNYSDFINPCGPLAPDQTDGISRIQAVLEYKYAVVTYEVRKNGNLIASGQLTGGQTTLTEGPGVYNIKYITTDNSGLEGSTSFKITVLDTIKPKAYCKPISIAVNPSGLTTDIYVLKPSEINDNSTDNCTNPLSYQVSPKNFTCNMAALPNNIYPVTLTVTDGSGNVATCTTTVQVLTEPCMPTYKPVCITGTLELTANPPGNYGNLYTYEWSHPSGSPPFSTAENPTISPVQPSDAGTYQVIAKGVTGCTSVGLVSVQPVSLPFTPVLLANTIPICFGDSIRLSTDTYNGQNVNYQWYTGPQSSSTLLGSTKDPGFIIKQPAVGIYQYFVIIGANGCTSVQSQPITVNVYARPVAVISSPPLAVNTYCEGQPITFSTSSQGTPQAPYSYQWTGPSSFNYTVQNPQLIPKAGLGNAGMYTLVVTQNGCVSDPAKVTVNVTPKPPVPMITADSLVCEGATVQLNCTPANAANYIWQYSGNPAINTTVPKLILPGVSVASTGDWKVQIIQNNCTSDASPTFHIDVQAYPDVSATAKITLCDYDTLKLNATANKPLPTWVWTGPSGFTTTYSQNTKSFPPHSGLYKVVGTTKNGCADSATVNVLAVTHPFVTATNDAPICSDGVSAARLQPVVVSMNGPFIFTWTGPGGWGGSSDSIPTIPSVSSANNGPYTVVVKDKYGCKSDPATTTINTQQLLKAPAILITPSSGIVCQGDTVTLKIDLANTSYPSTAKFIWHTPAAPNGLPPSAQSSMIIYGAQLADAGMYRVQVITDTCSSNISGPTTLVVHPNPAKPIPYYVTPLCEGGTLVLGIQNPVSGGTYTWSSTTPIPFAWTGQTATIPNVSQGNAGKYSVIVKLNGCVSTRGDTVVNIASAPKRPMIQPPNPSRFCREQAAQLKLLLKPDIVLPQTKFIWVLQQNNDTLSISSSTSFITNDLSHLHPGANTIRVKAYLNPCDSEWSDSVTVYLDTIPTGAQAYAGADRVLCISNGLKLDAAPVAGAAGIWTQTTGPTVIFNNTDPKTSVSGPGLAAGNIYRFAWTLSNGGCKNFSSDTVKIKTVAPEKAMAMDDTLRICSDTLVEIHAKQGVLSHGKWIQPGNQQDPLGVVIHQPDSTTTLITHLYASNLYVFYWTLADIGCGVSRDSVIVIDYSPKPDAGPDQPFCSPNPTYNLNASGIYPNIGETGLWTSKDTSLKFTNPTNNITTVRNLKYGLNEIYWTIDGGYCGLNSRDTVIINYQRQPTAVEDTIYVGYGKTIDFDVLTNDVFLPSYTFTTKTQPDHGTLTGNGTYTYQPDAGFSGQDQFIYQICNQLCKDSTLGCSATFVRINVASIGDCVIPTIITPNNDRVNDAFVIPASCLNGDGGGQIELTVFNQWGDLVYHSKPYNNDWEGTYNGQPLPVGTYFFELILNEQEKPKTGFLIIQQ